MSKYTTSYTSVNGPSCSYARLKTYANCARAEIRPSVPVSVAVAAPAAKVAVAAAPAPAAAAPAAAAPVAPVAPAAPAAEKFRMERFLDPSVDSLPGRPEGPTNYTPSYKVPNYEPINPSSLISAEATCGGYRKIITAYNNMTGSSCTTNYINN